MVERAKDIAAFGTIFALLTWLTGLLVNFGTSEAIYHTKTTKLDRLWTIAQIEAKFGFEFHTASSGPNAEVLIFTEAPYCDDSISFLPEPYHGIMTASAFLRIECYEASH